MARGKEGTFDKMRQFLRSYLKDGEQFKASTAYLEFLNSGQAANDLGRTISQKDFAMFLRTEALKKGGLLKRTAHGIYEKRVDPEEQSVTFARKNLRSEDSLDTGKAYPDSSPVTQTEESLDKLYEDTITLTARIRSTMQSLQRIGKNYPGFALELASYHAGLMKDMDRVATGLSAVMAWCEDHINGIHVGGNVYTNGKELIMRNCDTDRMLAYDSEESLPKPEQQTGMTMQL